MLKRRRRHDASSILWLLNTDKADLRTSYGPQSHEFACSSGNCFKNLARRCGEHHAAPVHRHLA